VQLKECVEIWQQTRQSTRVMWTVD